MMLFLTTLALAAEGHGGGHEAEGIPWGTLGITAANLILFLGILIWAARRPIGDALVGRANHVRAALDEAQKLHDEAQARYADIESKLQGLDDKIEAMKAEAARNADLESARVSERADADAQRIRDTAERTIREETQRARNAIRQEAVDAAASLARQHLERNVNADDQARLAASFLGAVKGDA